MGIGSKIRLGTKIIKYYRNWWVCFLEHFHLLKRKRVVYHLRSGMRFVGRPYTFDWGIINEVVLNKEYHRLLHFIKPDSTVVDIGGQIGTFTILAARRARRGRVITFEPFKENFDLLEKNIRINGVQDIVEPVNKGVGKATEQRVLHIDEVKSGNHTMFDDSRLDHPGDRRTREVKIDVISLDEAFKRYKIAQVDFMKIDCEGAEYEILYNASPKTLQRVRSISMEYHENGDPHKLKRFLEDNGFQVSFGREDQRTLFCQRLPERPSAS